MKHTRFIRSNSRNKIRRGVLSITLLLVLLTTLSAMPQQESLIAVNTRVVTDMRGREITIPNTINSLIALDAGALRLVS